MFGKKKKYVMYSEIIKGAISASNKVMADNAKKIKENILEAKQTMKETNDILKQTEALF